MRPERRADKFDLYSIRHAAEYLGMHTRTLHYRVKAGMVEHLRVSNLETVFTKAALDKFERDEARRKAAKARLSVKAHAAATTKRAA